GPKYAGTGILGNNSMLPFRCPARACPEASGKCSSASRRPRPNQMALPPRAPESRAGWRARVAGPFGSRGGRGCSAYGHREAQATDSLRADYPGPSPWAVESVVGQGRPVRKVSAFTARCRGQSDFPASGRAPPVLSRPPSTPTGGRPPRKIQSLRPASGNFPEGRPRSCPAPEKSFKQEREERSWEGDQSGQNCRP
ncbi:hypothetical protein E2I00_014880, partial [Balaenoptera physalus]